jgi:hypothetical protein
MWQIPLGNTKMRAMNNTWNHYQDNRVEWLLDDPGRAHLSEYLQAGVAAFLFGRGADGATCSCDAANDGVTNPAPINGNDRMSLNADDDGGFFREKATAYYASGAMPLDGGAPPPPTATRTPTGAPASPTPTPPSSGGATTVTFDDRSGQNQALNGQYPTGVIDWGSNAWWHSGPYGAFSTKSVSFTAGRTSASITLPTARRLVSLQAYNGGGAGTTITLSCSGQPNRQTTLAAGQQATVTTGWSGTCASVTIASTNGWDTNFDTFVLQ